MCRSIKTLFNFQPPASELEIREAALQFRSKAERIQRTVKGESRSLRRSR
jgi:hypothetical protein